MNTEILATYSVVDGNGTAVTVAAITNGFSVTLFDTDAGMGLGSTLFPTQAAAADAAVLLATAQAD